MVRSRSACSWASALVRGGGASAVTRALPPLRRSAAHTPAATRLLSSSALSEIDHAKLTTEVSTDCKPKPDMETLAFGQESTDHMLEVEWETGVGWGAPRIVPRHALMLDPACSALHYGLQIFEGMKAYVDKDDEIRMFRPDQNMVRMNSSAARLCMPNFDGEQFTECIKDLLKIEKDWIPNLPGYSLYIRPTMISNHDFLGVGPPAKILLFVILSPVGPYYKSGFQPVKLLATTTAVRAWPGGTGSAKCGGNYAPGILPQVNAAADGYAQILWLFGEDEQVTEVGTMNQFFFWVNDDGERELVTAPLDDGTILPGVTRRSILELTRGWGEFKVTERSYGIAEVIAAQKEGRLLEAFGSGTACIVSPVDGICYNGEDFAIPVDESDPSMRAGELTKRLAAELMGIQYGEIEGPDGWSVVVK